MSTKIKASTNNASLEKTNDATYRIAIPKGALFDGSQTALAKAGIHFDFHDRKLVFPAQDGKVEILLVKPVDVPVYVENGVANLGIVGSDVLGESHAQVLTLLDLQFGFCELAVAVKKDSPFQSASQMPDCSKIATKFPNLASQYFRKLGLPIEILKLSGSIEIAPLTGLAEAIVDLVATGRTLQENGLIKIETISKHSACLIANRVSWQVHNNWIVEILQAVSA